MAKIIIVHKPTRLDALVAKFNTVQQAEFYIEHLHGSFADYEQEHETYYNALSELSAAASLFGKVQLVDWKFLPNFIFGRDDLVVTIGQDGLIANTLKYLDGQKLIGINPDPGRWDGVLSPFSVDDSKKIIKAALSGDVPVRKVTKAKIKLSDSQTLYAVNDFFIGIHNHTSARYTITVGKESEYQSSSGIIVSTPLGRTGWMKSIIAGAEGVAGKADESQLLIDSGQWGSDSLMYAVREPFPSVNTGTNFVFGRIEKGTRFNIESKMGENGCIFSDGVESDYLDFNYSVVAEIGVAESKGVVVVKE
jgi:NAD kinase